MKRIAVISAILESTQETQKNFNSIVSAHKNIVKGRMGLPFDEMDMAVIAIAVVAEMDEINAFTGQLGKLPGLTIKTAVSPRELS
ncbi:MAG: iron-only hydrogenase system regulator [Clostridiales bacterium]|jgi:putative iron-only hydrogenase system regulator|nr:iron-only hydrogenase system regulator [Clostridiales bacterium]